MLLPFNNAKFSNSLSDSLLFFRVRIMPANENKRSTGAEEGRIVLYSIKVFLTIGYLFKLSNFLGGYCR